MMIYFLSKVGFDLFKDVLKRRRHPHPFVYRKGKTGGLPRAVVRVLAQYHHLDRIERTQVECAKNIFRIGIYRFFSIFIVHEARQGTKILLIKFMRKMRLPRRLDLHAHYVYTKRMDPHLQERLDDIDRKLDAVYRSAEKTRRYIWTFVVISVIALVLPLIGMVFAIPAFLNTYSSIQDL